MTQTNRQTMKRLTRIKLVNWHYFCNETIDVSGSFLISGENASGKSTVLDAIQLILTTNTRRFNPAANEKSKRDLKGYVRCKTGEEGNTYVRKNSVISYVALEFYEENMKRYFVLGAKFDSPDEESSVKQMWFCEEGTLEDFSFIVDGKPATDEQFRKNGKKINPIRTTKDARERFKRRLGNLEDTFFDMIPKSLAFKPMENVKKFITQFILPEKNIEIDTLRENIRNLREMQLLIEEVKGQIVHLQKIIDTNDKMNELTRDILVIDILLKIAEVEDKKEKTEGIKRTISLKKQELQGKIAELSQTETELRSRQEMLRAIAIDINNNECSKLISQLEQDQKLLEREREGVERQCGILKSQIGNILRALKYIPDAQAVIDPYKVRGIEKEELAEGERNELCVALKEMFKKANGSLNSEKAEKQQKITDLKKQLSELKSRIEKLKINQITYPANTVKLRDAIKTEFENRSISSEVRVFADLLEIKDTEWQNAVEGYLNTQRFNIIVEPMYYDIAAEVYDRLKADIENVALVNTGALQSVKAAGENTLATVVSAKNQYARAYATYLMGRVVMCEAVGDLKRHDISITKECMLYQSKTLRKIASEVYRIPYIGKYALKRQLEIAENDFHENKLKCDQLEGEAEALDTALDCIGECNFGMLEDSLLAPIQMRGIKQQLRNIGNELQEAKNDPNIIALQLKEMECADKVRGLSQRRDDLNEQKINLERDIKDLDANINGLEQAIGELEGQIRQMSIGDNDAITIARQKYAEHSKTKTAGIIYTNYGPRRSTLLNQRGDQRDNLLQLQQTYKDGELGRGEEYVSVYIQEHRTLSNHNLVEYEEKLNRAKASCEIQFRESFLARMRENIEDAQEIFKNLNKSLKNIYYGNDSYKFHYSAHRMKQGLYEMITSDVNEEGFTLFSNVFDEKYHNEMEELFSKLTESDERGDKILTEYTDYREYLDYDIEIISKDGKSQYFSKIYGEKSGGETQTPYYVAIAASFSQMYSVGETIRIIMLDEAFDKMDDDRIESMMKFFRSQNFQIILATPPAKMETIGEYVDTVLIAHREGNSSIVEEYDL